MHKVDRISIGYGNRILVRDISFELAPGELVLLAGPNGTGKTTLLKSLSSGGIGSRNLRAQSDLRPSHKWAPPSNVPRVAQFSEGVLPPQSIRIRGLMGMATNTEDDGVIEADFARIEALFKRIRTEHPELTETFTELSIGMSGDWPIAVRHGATMVRIGTDIFGEREY